MLRKSVSVRGITSSKWQLVENGSTLLVNGSARFTRKQGLTLMSAKNSLHCKFASKSVTSTDPGYQSVQWHFVLAGLFIFMLIRQVQQSDAMMVLKLSFLMAIMGL